ncbi:hypothetical protein B0A55_02129 [Friedmanniomyces simplex]|uniref:Uncharacterized protein n=1 Tax=Friedmanniomyces simplex TaxID=329884 RepID=A0A4U0XSU8_9PEZI|nr:hypothetical protein B0A55_02129 [Friedmanniomyces simplex]
MAQTSKVDDLTFLFFMLFAPKQCTARFQVAADNLGSSSAKAAEGRYYKLKKAHWDTVGGAALLQGLDSTATPTKTKKVATPKSKKHLLEADKDDEELPAGQKGKSDAKKVKVADEEEDQETPTKVELNGDYGFF